MTSKALISLETYNTVNFSFTTQINIEMKADFFQQSTAPICPLHRTDQPLRGDTRSNFLKSVWPKQCNERENVKLCCH